MEQLSYNVDISFEFRMLEREKKSSTKKAPEGENERRKQTNKKSGELPRSSFSGRVHISKNHLALRKRKKVGGGRKRYLHFLPRGKIVC